MTTLDPVTRLTRDIRNAAMTLSDREARFLVDTYYAMQRNRVRDGNQLAALDKSEEPHAVLSWLHEQNTVLEGQIARALDAYSGAHPVGKWMRSHKGVGPIIAAGLLAYIDITKAPTVGHIWSFAGLNPQAVWNKGEKRPWNANLKTLCWKLGQSFVYVSGDEDAFYARLYKQRKQDEWAKNLSGAFVKTCAETLDKKNFEPGTQTASFYLGLLSPSEIKKYLDAGKSIPPTLMETNIGDERPMLPPGRIQLRAQRYAVKIFLSSLHEVWRKHAGLDVPLPYPLAHMGHVHKIEIPA